MGDQRNPAGPKTRVFLTAGHLLAELGREFSKDGRDVHADFLENAPAHDRHDAATTRAAVAPTACVQNGPA